MEKISINRKRALEKALRNSKNLWKIKGFAMLPHRLIFDDRVGKNGLLVFWVLTIHKFRGKKGHDPELETIEKESRLSRPTVIKTIRDLENAGYIETEKASGIKTRYYLNGVY